MTATPYRVAFVTGGLQFGGSTTFLIHLASGLQATGIACEVFSLTQCNPLGADFQAASIPVHAWDESRLIFEDRMSQLCEAIARFRPTVVIANIGQDAYEVLRYMPRGVMRIGVIHDRIMNPQFLIPTYRDVLDHVVVVSAHLVSDVNAASPDTPCSYMTHGVPLPPDLLPRAANPAGPLKLIYFGRLTEGKGTRLFPLIIDALQQRRVPFQWTIHGCGSDESYLRQKLAAETARGEVVFSPPTSRDQLLALIRQQDIYMLASEIEGGPLTLLEGMALGLVPVCGDIPCLVQEVINAENGFRVAREKPDEYAAAIFRLHADRAILENMSRAAVRTITSHFTAVAMAQRYLKLFDQVRDLTGPPVWPTRFKIQSIRTNPNPWLSLPPIRALRRCLKRIRAAITL